MRSSRAENVPGAGCCSSGVIAIVSFLPEILPCRTACAIGDGEDEQDLLVADDRDDLELDRGRGGRERVHERVRRALARDRLLADVLTLAIRASSDAVHDVEAAGAELQRARQRDRDLGRRGLALPVVLDRELELLGLRLGRRAGLGRATQKRSPSTDGGGVWA